MTSFSKAAGPDNVIQVKELTRGSGVERALDCSANPAEGARHRHSSHSKMGQDCLCWRRRHSRDQSVPDSRSHDQKTIYGSWVTSTWLMEELVERLVRWNLHPADIITHRFRLEDAADAYALMATGKCGKVAVCSDEELILK